jgi:hypothetical protein
VTRLVRNDRGFLAEALVTALIAAALVGAAGAVLVNMSDVSRAAEKQAKPVAAIPAIRPAVPNGAAARECYLSVGARHRLTWTEAGWRENADHPLPEPTGDLPRDKGALEVWRQGLQNYIDDFAFEFDACDKTPPGENSGAQNPQATTSTTSIAGAVNWSGEYVLDIQNQSADCSGFPTQISVRQTTTTDVNIVVTTRGATLTTKATMNADAFFTGSSSESIDVTHTGTPSQVDTSVRGRFDLSGGHRVIRGGEYQASIGGGTCTVVFEASATN